MCYPRMEKFLFIDKRKKYPLNIFDDDRIDLGQEQSNFGVITFSS